MSGLDEQGTLMIPIPKNEELVQRAERNWSGKFGIVPEYWAGVNIWGNIMCWLVQKAKSGYKHGLIIARLSKEPIDIEYILSNIVAVRSVGPLADIKDEDFTKLIVDEMRRIEKRTGWCYN